MRLVIKDNSKLDKKKLENIDGVKGTFIAAGQLQIIIGVGTVNKVYTEFIKEGGIEEKSLDEVKKEVVSKQNLFFRLIKILGDIFVPIIPAIVASGILMGLLEGLTKIPALSSWTSNNWYVMLHSISNAAFSCLPILIAVSAAKTFKCNKLLAALVGIILVHPGLTNAWNIASMSEAELEAITLFKIGNWHIYLQGFQGHVIPIIISIWILSLIENKLHKVVPEMIDLFVTPLASVLATSVLSFVFIGPVFATAENFVLEGCKWFISLPAGIGGIIIGGLYALTVIAGLHHMYNTIEAGLLSKTKFNAWMPIATCVNVAQGAATLAVAVKTKNKKLKSIAYPATLSAYLGITEPAIFGVNLRYKKPLIAGCIGGAVGGWFVALLGVKANAYGVTGIFGILITMFDVKNLLLYLAGIGIASAAAFLVSFFLFKDEKLEEETETIKEKETAKNKLKMNPIKSKATSLNLSNDLLININNNNVLSLPYLYNLKGSNS